LLGQNFDANVAGPDLACGYAEMAADEARAREVDAWSGGLIADVADEPQRRGH
jgi:hypothetical protein